MSIKHQKKASKYRKNRRDNPAPFKDMVCNECWKPARMVYRRGGAELWRCPHCGWETYFTYEEETDDE